MVRVHAALFRVIANTEIIEKGDRRLWQKKQEQ